MVSLVLSLHFEESRWSMSAGYLQVIKRVIRVTIGQKGFKYVQTGQNLSPAPHSRLASQRPFDAINIIMSIMSKLHPLSCEELTVLTTLNDAAALAISPTQ